jgi:NAD(P)H dehydrogenase (quinone)
VTNPKPTLLVTGASGNLGRRTVELLLQDRSYHVIAATRRPEAVASLAEAGAEVRHMDFDDQDTLRPAFDGADRVLIISTDQLAVPGRRQLQHRAALRAAVAAGVGHIAYTSMPNPVAATPIVFAADHVDMEQALAACGIRHSILRNSWYAEDLLFLLPSILASGRWYSSARDGRIAYVAREDAARAAAACLRLAGESQTYDITGPQTLTVREIAALIQDVFGHPVAVCDVGDERLAGDLAAAGVPDFYVPMAAMTDANQRAGNFAVLSTAVQDLTGQGPQRLKDFLSDRKAAFLPPARRV